MGKGLRELPSGRFHYTAVPAFRLSSIRFQYRKLFIEAMASGRIKIENIEHCDCGSKDLLTLAEQDRFGLPFQTKLCQSCGLAFTSPRIAEESLPLYYQKYYHPLVLGTKEGKAEEDLVRTGQGDFIFNFLKERIQKLNKTKIKICEIGCASGTNLLEIQKACESIGIQCELYGTEFEVAHADKAQRDGIKVLKSDVSSLEDFHSDFDIIIMSHVFEHIAELGQCLDFIKKVMQKQTLLYIEVPGIFHLERYDQNLLDYLVHAHMYHFCLGSLKSVLERNGFEFHKGTEEVQGLFTLSSETASPDQVKDPHLAKRFLDYLGEVEKNRESKSFVKQLYYTLMTCYYKSEHTLFTGKKLKSLFSF